MKTESSFSPYAHNLVNSLYAMKGMIETFLLNQEEGRFASEKEILEKSQGVLKRAFLQADQAIKIVKRLGTIRDTNEFATSETSIRHAWQEALSLLEGEWREKEVEILERIPVPFPLVKCPKEDLKEIFFHLIQNAFQALQEKGILVIRSQVSFSTKEEPFALIQISDTGPGMPDAVLSHLFEPFFTTKLRGAGNGLGIYLTRQLVHRNRGRISAASFKGWGTTFTLEFPLEKALPIKA